MTIKYQKANKKFILEAINPQLTRKNKRKYAPNVFSYYRVNDDYIQFGIAHKINSSCIKPEDAVLNGTMIENLEKEYEFCSVSSRKKGLDVILRRDRWNECDGCKKVLWIQTKRKGHIPKRKFRVVNDNFKSKALCIKCFNRKWKVSKDGDFVKK